MRQNTLSYFLVFIVYLALQVFLFNNMVLFGTAFCFIYIAFILFLPFRINPVFLISLGFFGGLITDIFYNSMGVNAAAMTFLAFIRRPWILLLTPPGGYDDIPAPTAKALGLSWFVFYAIPLTFIHHLVLFTVEAGHFPVSWQIGRAHV